MSQHIEPPATVRDMIALDIRAGFFGNWLVTWAHDGVLELEHLVTQEQRTVADPTWMRARPEAANTDNYNGLSGISGLSGNFKSYAARIWQAALDRQAEIDQRTRPPKLNPPDWER